METSDDISANKTGDKYLIKTDDYEFLFIIDIENQDGKDILTIQVYNKNNHDKYKIQITNDDIISSGLSQLKTLRWFKMIIQLALDKLMKPVKKNSHAPSQYQIDTELFTLGFQKLKILNKIHDMTKARLEEYQIESKALSQMHHYTSDIITTETISSPLDIGGLLLVINFKAIEHNVQYNIGIQLPKLLTYTKKEYRKTRSTMIDKLIQSKKLLMQTDNLKTVQNRYDSNNSNSKDTLTKISPDKIKSLKDIKEDFLEVEKMISELNYETQLSVSMKLNKDKVNI